MKFLFYAFAFIATNQAHADFFFIQEEKIYSVDSKYSPEKVPLERARFLRIDVKKNLKNGTVSYKMGGIASLEAFDLSKTPATPKIEAPEGCGKNPMSWLKSSKVLGKLKKKESAVYVQLPLEVTSFGKTAAKCPADERFSDESLQFSTADKDFAVLVCSDDLNYNLLLMKENSIVAELVITDNCP